MPTLSPTPNCQLRAAAPADADALAAIYNHYVRDSIVTFEEEALAPQMMAARVADVAAATLPWLIAQCDGTLVGYAYAAPWKGRRGYRFSVESTVYLDPRHTGNGFGTQLYRELLAQLRAQGLHSAIGGVALPNAASVALHERLGFRQVARFEQVGIKFGRWIDVGYWQLLL